MDNFKRGYPLFSLCGLNCGLCPMHLGDYCPGCGGGAGNQPCAIARCSLRHGGIEYCYLCDEYPCEKYDGIDAFDSFITHRNQLKDIEKVKKIGIDSYQSELAEKIEILRYLLANYNDGRRKNFYCIAVNLLELQDVKSVMEQIATKTGSDNLTFKEKAILAVDRKIELTLDRQIKLTQLVIKSPLRGGGKRGGQHVQMAAHQSTTCPRGRHQANSQDCGGVQEYRQEVPERSQSTPV
jgi:hypothetical protein